MKTIYQQMRINIIGFVILIGLVTSSCGAKKKMAEAQERFDSELAIANKQLGECGEELSKYMNRLAECEKEKERLQSSVKLTNEKLSLREEQIEDLKSQRSQQVEQIGDLTVLSKGANENIKETLSQLEGKDRYINLLQAAKTKVDSINLALAVNLKGVLSQGISDQDVDIQVDKTVVFVNISDKMLFYSGRSDITPRASEVLGKIAKIIESRPNLEVMVEGYTDNMPISSSCMKDNWDLSVKRATSVVRVLQQDYNIDPNRLIAAGRGEYNALASNETIEGRSANRRTRIIILPKLDQFYDLLNPEMAPK